MTTPTIAQPIALAIDFAAKDAREDKRYERGQYVDTTNTCYCCGRKAGAHWVAIDLRTTVAVSTEYAKTNEDDVAYFPVGNVCRKRFALPKSHVLTRKALWG